MCANTKQLEAAPVENCVGKDSECRPEVSGKGSHYQLVTSATGDEWESDVKCSEGSVQSRHLRSVEKQSSKEWERPIGDHLVHPLHVTCEKERHRAEAP